MPGKDYKADKTSRCPQKCEHPAHGVETMVLMKETIPLDEPKIFKHHNETVVLHEEVRKYFRCRVCGRTVDI